MTLLGQKFAQYEVVEKLGQGGMGEVYKAHDHRLGRNVALKVLSPQASRDEVLKRRFNVEARAASALNHPYILTVYEIGTLDGCDYMVMEYVRGITLRERLAQGHLSVMDALEIFTKVAEGLAKAHENKIIHRDLKPENLMITTDGFVKILDFGLAKLDLEFAEKSPEQMVSDPNIIQGTVGYLAPEIIQGQPADPRTDIFALGVIIFESLAGYLPFRGRNLGERLVATMQYDPGSLSAIRGDVPFELDNIVKKALAKEPTDRYQTIAPMLEELRALKRELDVEASISSDRTPRSLLDDVRRSIPSGELKRSAKSEEDSRGFAINITSGTDISSTRKIEKAELNDSISNQPTVSITRYRTIRYALAGVTTLLIIFAALFWYRQSMTVPLSPLKSDGKIPLAVIYFENISNDQELKWLERGIAEMLTTNLAQFDTLDVLSSQQLYDLLRRVDKADGAPLDGQTAVEVARKARVNAFVTGAIIKIGNRIRLSVTLQETSSGKILFSDKFDGENVDEIFGVVDKVTIKIAERLDARKDSGRDIKIADVTTESVAAFKHYEQGVEMTMKLYLTDAVHEFEQAIAIDPNFAMAYLQLGIAKLRAEDDEGTRRAISRAVDLIDRVAPKEKLFIRGLEAVVQGKAEKRIDCFKELTERYPNEKEAYRQLGMAYLSDEQIDAAIASFQKTIQIDPDYQEGHNRLAYAFLTKGQFEDAIKHARRYVELAGDEPNPHDTMGDVYQISGQYENAIKEYERVVELKPDFINYFAYWKLASTYRTMGQLERAEETYRKHLELQRGYAVADSVKSLAMVALLRGDRVQAAELLNKALEQEIERGKLTMAAVTAIDQMLFYYELGDLNRASSSAIKARQLLNAQKSQRDIFAPYNDRIFERNYIKLMLARGEADKVEAEIENFLQERMDRFTPYSRDIMRLFARASVEDTRGNFSAALVLWQQLRDKSGIPQAYAYQIGRSLFHLGRFNEALSEFERLSRMPVVMHQQASNSLGVEPIMENLRSIYFIGRIAEAKGEKERAKEYYRKLMGLWTRPTFKFTELADAEKRLAALGS